MSAIPVRHTRSALVKPLFSEAGQNTETRAGSMATAPKAGSAAFPGRGKANSGLPSRQSFRPKSSVLFADPAWAW